MPAKLMQIFRINKVNPLLWVFFPQSDNRNKKDHFGGFI